MFLVHFKQEKHFGYGKVFLGGVFFGLFCFSFKCPGEKMKYFVHEYLTGMFCIDIL